MAYARFNPDTKILEVFEFEDGGVERCVFNARVMDIHLEFGFRIPTEEEVADLNFEDERQE